MKIAHVGPQLKRTGGPAGYLLELQRQAESSGEEGRHRVRFPEPSPSVPASRNSSRRLERARRWKRALMGPPRFYRPSRDEMNRDRGVVHEIINRAADDAVALSRPSFEVPADVYFVHDLFALEAAKAKAGSGEVWLMIHSPMPMGLYLAWNWGHPEWHWEEITALPDVRRWIDKELAIWSLAESVVLPCPEALEELARVDRRFEEAGKRVEYLLTGSSAVESEAPGAGGVREIVGLFLGSGQSYRGLDVLLQAVALLPPKKELPGEIVIAGPNCDSIPTHPRVRCLGRVEDVPSLLATVDFVVNANRFSLFDLSNVEAAAAGKALLLHAIGGNKALARLGAGCRLFEPLNPESLATALIEVFSMSREALSALGARSRECYSRHLTGKAMWQRHLDLYDKAETRIAV